MRKLSEGHKMFASVMVIFAVYAVVFLLFEDYDRHVLKPFDEASDWHLLLFSLAVMAGLTVVLYRYARRMDERISRDQVAKESQMRRELTQNIAHELKTPVASILGYTETLIDNPDIDPDTRLQFVRRTHAQARRLTGLLQDISTLNRIDYAPDQLTFERVNVSQLVADIVQETALAVASKQMTLHNCLPADIHLHGNASLLYSLFRNLTDNAVNYAGQGTRVSICADERPDHWHFTFSDNGQGIADEHLPRIFERFYRIDKGRSRSNGGTGLGLAIVKHTVELHGGTIAARRAEGGGLRFDFTLSKGETASSDTSRTAFRRCVQQEVLRRGLTPAQAAFVLHFLKGC